VGVSFLELQSNNNKFVEDIVKDKLTSFVEDIKSLKDIRSYDEQATKQGVILKILSVLGWDVFDINEVYPEYVLKGQRIDYSLRIENKNKVFIEAKRISEELDTHQEQLLKYAFQAGVSLAILTNGLSWWFYLPLMKDASWEERKFYTIDLVRQEPTHIADKFIDLLSRANVSSGEAIRNAEATHADLQKKNIIKKTLPEAWNKIISEPDETLLNLLKETTETLCGHSVGTAFAKNFLVSNKDGLTLLEKPVVKPTPQTRRVIQPAHLGRTAQVWAYLEKLRPGMRRENVGLLIEIDKGHTHIFEIDWRHTGKELLILSQEGLRRKPINAIKEVFGNEIAAKHQGFARKMWVFVDTSKSPPEAIARFGEFERYLDQEKKYGIATPLKPIKQKVKDVRELFSQRTSYAKRTIRNTILERKPLWKFFLKNGQMTVAQFKDHSHFKPKAVAGFIQFLTKNGIATRDGDLFILNEAAIPHIEQLLRE
jgi:predicted type IV restriction endonuclease